jgi:hypothetical protein
MHGNKFWRPEASIHVSNAKHFLKYKNNVLWPHIIQNVWQIFLPYLPLKNRQILLIYTILGFNSR